jgi:nicotinamidase-related amidase
MLKLTQTIIAMLVALASGAAAQAQQPRAIPVRDQVEDHLLTPKNCALIIIDYQPIAVGSIQSMDPHLLTDNIVRTVRAAKVFGVPIVLSTTGVNSVHNAPTIPELQAVLGNTKAIDRTTLNAWEDPEFLAAVKATGRKKLIICGLWTEVCFVFPALDALRAGYEVYTVVDAEGGTSMEAHQAGLQRFYLAGGRPTSWVQFISELQRDTARTATLKPFVDILFDPKVPFMAGAKRKEN